MNLCSDHPYRGHYGDGACTSSQSGEYAGRLLRRLEKAANELADLESDPIVETEAGFHLVASGIYAVSAAVRLCVDVGFDRKSLNGVLARLRDACQSSPFTRHISEWPLGYAGDFRIIDQICSQENRAPRRTFAYWIEEHSLACAMAQQHRNKVREQAREILECARARTEAGETASIAILACGSSPDLALVARELSQLQVRIVAVDSDAAALEETHRRLVSLGGKLETVHGNVARLMGELARLGPYDLVLAGGLFDYLPDRVAESVVRNVNDKLLRSAGVLFFTNMAEGNPYEAWTRYVCNCRLIQRSAADIARLTSSAGIQGNAVTTGRDLTRLSLLVKVVRSST